MQSDQLRPWVPILRRLARASLGRQGDVAVRLCVQRLLGGAVPTGEPRRHVLRTLVLAIRDIVERAPPATVTATTEAVLLGRIAAMPLQQRLALLLSRLEGLPTCEVARALDLPPWRAESLLRRALDRLAPPEQARVLVIEDEACVALDLEQLVERSGHSVIGIAATHAEALSLAATAMPQLIPADFQLAGRDSGLEAVQAIARRRAVPAIFITAFPERVLLESGALPDFVLRKPFDHARLGGLISEALVLGSGGIP
jgi:CheY-like chemotaxis protein